MLALSICGFHSMNVSGQVEENVWGLWGCKFAWKCWHILCCNSSQFSIFSRSSLQGPQIFFNMFKSVQDMISLGIGKLFDTKIVTAKLFCFLCCMSPEGCRVFAAYIAMRRNIVLLSCCIPILQLVLNLTLFFILMLTYPLIYNFSCRFYCCIMSGRELLLIYSYVICLIHWRGQKEIIEVACHEPWSFFCIRNGTIKEQFIFNARSSWWSRIIWITKFVSTGNTMCTIYFTFMWLIVA